MAGRNYVPRQLEPLRGPRDDPRLVMYRGPGSLLPHPAILEEELELQHRDMQRILAENRHVIDENVILQRELAAVNDEIHRLSQVIPKLRADSDAQARDLIERGLKLETELRGVEPLRSEVVQLRAEAQKLSSFRQDLTTQVQTLKQDITRMQAEIQQLSARRNDVDVMRKEIMETRRAIEYEKKANEEQVEQKQAMEKNLISMAREIEKLRAEQMTTERRGHFGAGGYGMLKGSPDLRYSAGAYDDIYGGGFLGAYENRGAGGYGMLEGSLDLRYSAGAYDDIYGGGFLGAYENRGPTHPWNAQ